LGALLALALPLASQQPAPRDSARPQMMPGRGMMMHMQMDDHMAPMMRLMAFAPGHLLERKDVLGLTAQQVTRLTALRDEAQRAHDAAAADARQHHEALSQAAQAATDTAALRRHFQAAHGAMGNAHWIGLRAAVQARGVLTEAQRGRVDGWVDAMQMHQRMQRTDQPHEGHGRP
jgi:hypothetical protein